MTLPELPTPSPNLPPLVPLAMQNPAVSPMINLTDTPNDNTSGMPAIRSKTTSANKVAKLSEHPSANSTFASPVQISSPLPTLKESTQSKSDAEIIGNMIPSSNLTTAIGSSQIGTAVTGTSYNELQKIYDAEPEIENNPTLIDRATSLMSGNEWAKLLGYAIIAIGFLVGLALLPLIFNPHSATPDSGDGTVIVDPNTGLPDTGSPIAPTPQPMHGGQQNGIVTTTSEPIIPSN